MNQNSAVNRPASQYIQTSVEFFHDSRLRMLAGLIAPDLGVPGWVARKVAGGVLQELWRALRQRDCRDGILSEVEMQPRYVAAMADYEGDPDILFSALRQCGWLVPRAGGLEARGYAKRYRPMYERRERRALTERLRRRSAAEARVELAAQRKAKSAARADERRARTPRVKSRRGFIPRAAIIEAVEAFELEMQIADLTQQNASLAVTATSYNSNAVGTGANFQETYKSTAACDATSVAPHDRAQRGPPPGDVAAALDSSAKANAVSSEIATARARPEPEPDTAMDFAARLERLGIKCGPAEMAEADRAAQMPTEALLAAESTSTLAGPSRTPQKPATRAWRMMELPPDSAVIESRVLVAEFCRQAKWTRVTDEAWAAYQQHRPTVGELLAAVAVLDGELQFKRRNQPGNLGIAIHKVLDKRRRPVKLPVPAGLTQVLNEIGTEELDCPEYCPPSLATLIHERGNLTEQALRNAGSGARDWESTARALGLHWRRDSNERRGPAIKKKALPSVLSHVRDNVVQLTQKIGGGNHVR